MGKAEGQSINLEESINGSSDFILKVYSSILIAFEKYFFDIICKKVKIINVLFMIP